MSSRNVTAESSAHKLSTFRGFTAGKPSSFDFYVRRCSKLSLFILTLSLVCRGTMQICIYKSTGTLGSYNKALD